jgi:hypothetical protein
MFGAADREFDQSDDGETGTLDSFASAVDEFDDSLDQFLGEWSDPVENSLTSPSHSTQRGPSHGRRRQYGAGIDARRTAQYRHYLTDRSNLMTHLESRYGTITKSLLLDLIRQVVSSSPDWNRPDPPTRNQRRVKGGLAAWLDEHWIHVMRHWTSHGNAAQDKSE